MINSFKIKVKRGYLQFKKDKLNGHKAMENNLLEIFPESDFVFFDSDHITSTLLRVRENQVSGLSSRNRLAITELDLGLEEVKRLFSFCAKEVTDLSSWLLVIPQVWERSGGFLMLSETVFGSLEKISSLLDDDFDLFSENLSDQICFRGNRVNNELTSMEIRMKGDEFLIVKCY